MADPGRRCPAPALHCYCAHTLGIDWIPPVLQVKDANCVQEEIKGREEEQSQKEIKTL